MQLFCGEGAFNFILKYMPVMKTRVVCVIAPLLTENQFVWVLKKMFIINLLLFYYCLTDGFGHLQYAYIVLVLGFVNGNARFSSVIFH